MRYRPERRRLRNTLPANRSRHAATERGPTKPTAATHHSARLRSPPPPFFLQAKLTAGPPAGASDDSWKPSPSSGPAAGDDGSWEFPDLLATSEALAAEMLSESMATDTSAKTLGFVGTAHGGSSSAAGAGGRAAVGGFYNYKRSSSMPVPPPPEFRLSVEDVDRHRCVFVPRGSASVTRREQTRSVEAFQTWESVLTSRDFRGLHPRSTRQRPLAGGLASTQKCVVVESVNQSFLPLDPPMRLVPPFHARSSASKIGFRSTTKALRCPGGRRRWIRSVPRATSSTSTSFL